MNYLLKKVFYMITNCFCYAISGQAKTGSSGSTSAYLSGSGRVPASTSPAISVELGDLGDIDFDVFNLF